MDPPLYFDHNATAPLLPEVADAMHAAALRYPANPESQHQAGRSARRALEDAREQIGRLLGAQMAGRQADRVIFTSGGTEANNLALTGLAPLPASEPPPELIISAIEHPCVSDTAAKLQQCGWKVEHAASNAHGVVSAAQYADLLSPQTRLVSLMLANNETGVLQPVSALASLCRTHNILVHTDAAQAVGKVPVDFSRLGVNALCCAAHKFHGPPGIGVLLLRHGVTLQPSLHGGHQQAGLRPGTESVALAIGMRTALECWQREATQHRERVAALRDRFEQHITAEFPAAQVIGRSAERLPNTSNISFLGLDRQSLLMALDQVGLACSTGAACASGSSEPSPVLVAMGLGEAICDGAIRFSFGATTTTAEVRAGVARILNVCKRLRQVAPA